MNSTRNSNTTYRHVVIARVFLGGHKSIRTSCHTLQSKPSHHQLEHSVTRSIQHTLTTDTHTRSNPFHLVLFKDPFQQTKCSLPPSPPSSSPPWPSPSPLRLRLRNRLPLPKPRASPPTWPLSWPASSSRLATATALTSAAIGALSGAALVATPLDAMVVRCLDGECTFEK